jgi:hypothetical protein
MLKFELNRKMINNLSSDLNNRKSVDFQPHKSYTKRCGALTTQIRKKES